MARLAPEWGPLWGTQIDLDDPELVEHLSDALFRWNTPETPYFAILGRNSDLYGPDENPYTPIARAVVAALKERGQ